MNSFENIYLEFHKSLKEVNLFLEYSEDMEKKKEKDISEGNLTELGINKHNEVISLYNRSATLFLASKFETFIEDLIEKYAIELQKIKLPSSVIPDLVKKHCIERLLNEDFISSIVSKKYDDIKKVESQIETLSKIKDLIDPEKKVNVLPIDNKFSYGKHGINDIINLFKRIGIENIFNECPIFKTQENLLSGDTEERINIQNSLNVLIKARNEIIHRNEIPDISRFQIDECKSNILLFYKKITIVLQIRIDSLVIHSGV